MTNKTTITKRRTRQAIAIAATVGLLGIAAGPGSADAGRTASRAAISQHCGHSFRLYRVCAW